MSDLNKLARELAINHEDSAAYRVSKNGASDAELDEILRYAHEINNQLIIYIATKIKADNAKTRGALEYVGSIDPPKNENIARNAPRVITDSNGRTMIFRRFIPYHESIKYDVKKLAQSLAPTIGEIVWDETILDQPKEKTIDIMAVTRGMCK